MTKLLKVRVLLPALILTYVLLGVFVVPKVEAAAGHMILLLLAAASMVLLGYWFHRYVTIYSDTSQYEGQEVLKVTLMIAAGVVFLMLYHLVALIFGVSGLWNVYGAEIGVLIVSLTVWLVYQNNKK